MQLTMASNNKIESYTIKNGFCAFINIKYFDGHKEYTRRDSEENNVNVNKTFEFLNCKVKCYEESNFHFTDKQVRNVIIE